MGRIEYQMYINDTLSEINDRVSELYEAMMDRDDEEVLRICALIDEKLNLIKEYHTDETVLLQSY
jgi:hypothetical protein